MPHSIKLDARVFAPIPVGIALLFVSWWLVGFVPNHLRETETMQEARAAVVLLASSVLLAGLGGITLITVFTILLGKLAHWSFDQ